MDTPGGPPPAAADPAADGLRQALRRFMQDRFDLKGDQAYEGQTLESVRRDVQFRGANLWILMFAILICSVGLNVNSPAVVIGAMLISPLMGPILGLGVAAAIFDFDLLLTSAKNMGIAVVMSIAVSALYFAVTPITEAQSELLARVSPTVWDVLIATCGGFAGIIAVSRREKGNAVPGVAIATALMPPICTAGYGLAVGEWKYLAGALYLFFINLVFIALATFTLVRFMRFGRHQFVDAAQERRVKRVFYAVALAVAVPSVYTAYTTVERTVYLQRANKFVDEECRYPAAQLIARQVSGEEEGERAIDLVFVGANVPADVIEAWQARMERYGLTGTQLRVMQDVDEEKAAAIALQEAAPGGAMDVLYKRSTRALLERDSLLDVYETRLRGVETQSDATRSLLAEARTLFPELRGLRYARLSGLSEPGHGKGGERPSSTPADTARFGALFVRRATVPRSADRERLRRWAGQRLGLDSVLVVGY